VADRVRTEPELRALYGEPSEVVKRKVIDHVDPHARRFIELSPFCCLGTTSDAGGDVSPRGDHPGFVRVLSETELLIPDRVGNNRVDSLRNLVQRPQVGLLFLVPGLNDMLRINGTGRITGEPEILAAAAVEGRAPRSGLLVTVQEVFFHCGRAAKRARLWDPEAKVERSAMPRIADMIRDQLAEPSLDPELDRLREETYMDRLY
jgi:PPOX class probable FMN-dependent enzyme